MADTLTKAKRSALMAKVRGKGNRSTEIRLITSLRAEGIKGWRRANQLPGKPDLIFSDARLAVFVDGCFWHGCPSHYRRPKTRRRFWDKKVHTNRERDRQVNRTLRKMGWAVVRIWEHALNAQSSTAYLAKIKRLLH